MREHWLLGPPGTGKTTTLSRLITEAAKQYGSDGVLVSSFTKAAAVELAGRNLPLDHTRVGTLHALCYRAMGQPEIAESNIREFNDECKEHKLSVGSSMSDEGVWEYDPKAENDAYFAVYQQQRARRIPPMKQTFNGSFDPAYMRFVLAWEGWKKSHEYMDFSDLLEHALHDLDGSPIDANILFVDEAQDCTPLMMAVARKWASGMDKLVLGFDEEQSLYTWAGADPEQLFATEPDEPPTVLSQSYRVPRAVHAKADAWRKKLSWRIEKEYLPRDEDGWVKNRLDLDYEHPESTVRLVEEYVKQGKSVMILASCGYMLRPAIKAMKAEGIPFANRYRPNRGDWNPLDPGTSRRHSPVSRVKAYLRVSKEVWGNDARLWNTDDFRAWASHIRADDLFKKGVKAQLAAKDFSLPSDETQRAEAIVSLLLEDAPQLPPDRNLITALSGDLEWLERRLQGDTGERMRYPIKIAQKLGPRSLLDKPLVTVGTIHCSPPDEPILTVNRGYVPIAEMMEGSDRIVGYADSTNDIFFGTTSARNGYPFQRSVRQHDGEILTIITDSTRTRVTPEHRVRARFAPSAQGKFVVYLMKRGDWWRVGITCAPQTGTNTSVGVNTRLSRERGEAAWVLRLCETRKEAAMEEAKISGYYGIPGLIFEAGESSFARTFTGADLREVHTSTCVAVSERAIKLCHDFGIDPSLPLWSRNNKVRAGYSFETAATNLVPGLMEVPRYVKGERKPEWVPFSLSRNPYSGLVYGLHVPPHEHYISGGLIVHNSVKGAEADVAVLFPDISALGHEEWREEGPRRDAIIRMMYVGMTRAREGLVLAGNAGPKHVPLWQN